MNRRNFVSVEFSSLEKWNLLDKDQKLKKIFLGYEQQPSVEKYLGLIEKENALETLKRLLDKFDMYLGESSAQKVISSNAKNFLPYDIENLSLKMFYRPKEK